MRRVVAVSVALSLLAAACSGGTGSATTVGSGYPPAVVAAFMEGCTEDLPVMVTPCRCVIEELQRRMPLDDFLALEEAGLETDPAVLEVTVSCAVVDPGTSTTSPGGPGPADTIDGLIAVTITDLEEYWAHTMPRVWGMVYEPPALVGGYHVGRGEVPECGGPLSRSQYEYNAFYCRLDDSIQWDMDLLMASLYEEYGDFTVALVLAHEWGHAIQARFGFDDATQPTIVSELQADCLAGAWTGWVDRGESLLIELDPGDLEEAMAGFLLIGDELGTAPTGHDAHGTAFERLNAFFDGYNGGAEACAGYEDEWPLMISWSLEQSELDLPYDIAAEVLAEALEVFWSTVYPDLFGSPWRPVASVVPYHPSTGELPACGGFVVAEDFYRFNIFYCPSDDFVAWDEERLFPTLYAEVGDFAIGLLLALQWGQAVQSRAGLPMEGAAASLQADCFAGAWTAALTFEDNPMLVYLSAGDLEEGVASFLLFSDHESDGVPAFRRFEAFKSGLLDGIEACGV